MTDELRDLIFNAFGNVRTDGSRTPELMILAAVHAAIAQAVAAERARVYEACAEVAQGKMMMLTLQNDSVTVWNTACMLIHDAIRARAAQESEGEKK